MVLGKISIVPESLFFEIKLIFRPFDIEQGWWNITVFNSEFVDIFLLIIILSITCKFSVCVSNPE